MRSAWVLAALLLTALGGCSADMFPVTDPQHRFACKGFSVLPPNGPGWFLDREPDWIERQVTFFKRGPKPEHTVIATAFPLDGIFQDVPTLQKHLREQLAAGIWEPRWKRRSEHVEIEKIDGREVVVGRETAEDHGALGKNEATTTVTTRYWTFLDPNTKRASQLWVSERLPKGDAPLAIEGEVASFVQGFEFVAAAKPVK